MAKEIGEIPKISPVEIAKVAEHLRDLRRVELERKQLDALRNLDSAKQPRPADPRDRSA